MGLLVSVLCGIRSAGRSVSRGCLAIGGDCHLGVQLGPLYVAPPPWKSQGNWTFYMGTGFAQKQCSSRTRCRLQSCFGTRLWSHRMPLLLNSVGPRLTAWTIFFQHPVEGVAKNAAIYNCSQGERDIQQWTKYTSVSTKKKSYLVLWKHKTEGGN